METGRAASHGRLAHPRLRGRLTPRVLHWRMDARYSGSPRAHSCQRQPSRTWVEASWCPPAAVPPSSLGAPIPAMQAVGRCCLLSRDCGPAPSCQPYAQAPSGWSLSPARSASQVWEEPWVPGSVPPLCSASASDVCLFQDEACRCLEALTVSLRA